MSESLKPSHIELLKRGFRAARRARIRNGGAYQDDRVREEMAELLLAMMHANRGRGKRGAVSREAADLLLALLGLMTEWSWEELEKKVDGLERLLSRERLSIELSPKENPDGKTEVSLFVCRRCPAIWSFDAEQSIRCPVCASPGNRELVDVIAPTAAAVAE